MAVGCRDIKAEHDGQFWCNGSGNLNGDTGILNIKDGFNKQCVNTTIDKGADLF